MSRLDAALALIQRWDELLCVRVNRRARWRPVVLCLQAVSWLGNGVFWYALMLVLLLRFWADEDAGLGHFVARIARSIPSDDPGAQPSRPVSLQDRREDGR